MKNLIVLTDELIPVYQGDISPLVDGRELHSFLEVGTKFSDWMKDRIEKYEFVEFVDFTSFPKKRKAQNTWVTTIEYTLTIDMAKEISMVQNNERGSEARKYFIAVEKKFKEISKPESIEDLIIMQAERLNYLDVIAEDKKLIEIYTAIVKEMAIKYKLA